MKTSFDFTDNHVVVFGGTTGINLAIAHAFAQAGARVAVASRKQANIDAAVGALAAHGGEVMGLMADVRDFDAVGRAFEAAHDRFGAIDVLVSGAAGNFLSEANGLSSNGFKVVVDIDLNGTFHVMRQSFAYLNKPGASVINITAPQSQLPMRYQAHVCAAKAGIDQLTRVLAIEWGGAGVRVNAISPGPIAGTEGVKRLAPPGEAGDRIARDHIPLGRMGTPEEVANLVLYLCSDEAAFVTGQAVPLDGGKLVF